MMLSFNIFFLYFPTAGDGNTFGVVIPEVCCVKPQKIKSPSVCHRFCDSHRSQKKSHNWKWVFFFMGCGNTVSKPEFFWKLLWSEVVQGKVAPSFVLVIRYFNNNTLEPREPPIVTESKEDMKKLDRDEREINGPGIPWEISGCFIPRA